MCATAIAKKYQNETAIFWCVPANFAQAKSLTVKSQTFFEIEDIDIIMIEFESWHF